MDEYLLIGAEISYYTGKSVPICATKAFRFVKSLRVRKSRPKQSYPRRNEPWTRGKGPYVINQGKTLVTKALKDGESKTISELYPGDRFGEMSPVTDKPTSASVVANGAMRCLFISHEKFMRLIDDSPAIGQKALWACSITRSMTAKRWLKFSAT